MVRLWRLPQVRFAPGSARRNTLITPPDGDCRGAYQVVCVITPTNRAAGSTIGIWQCPPARQCGTWHEGLRTTSTYQRRQRTATKHGPRLCQRTGRHPENKHRAGSQRRHHPRASSALARHHRLSKAVNSTPTTAPAIKRSRSRPLMPSGAGKKCRSNPPASQKATLKAAMKRAWEIRGAQRREHPKSMAKPKTHGRRGLTTRYPRESILHGYLETA